MKTLKLNEMENVEGGALNEQQNGCLTDMLAWGGAGALIGAGPGFFIGVALAGLFSYDCNR